jgi:hypothetical protein
MPSSDELLYELTWVHISDIHETGRPGAEDQHRRLVLQRLLEDLDRCSELGAPSPSVVIVTGDVAMTGGAVRADEYAGAQAFLRSLVDHLSPGTSLMIVPGNHDCRRAAADDATTLRMLRAAREGAERIDDLLVRSDDAELLERRMMGYQDFIRSMEEIDSGIGAETSVLTGWSRRLEGRSLAVRFVGLNTALLDNDESDREKLQLGFTQVRTATANAAAGQVMILMTHHPLDWLSDSEEIGPVLAQYFDLHLYGHLHLPKSARLGLLQRRGLISIGAGATYHGLTGEGVGAGEYSYSICSLGWNQAGELMLQIWPRIWSTRAGRWGPDQAVLEPGCDYGTFVVPGHDRDPETLKERPQSLSAWTRWSDKTIRNFGRRRTAYPLDLTIAELFEREVKIDTHARPYVSDRADQGGLLTDLVLHNAKGLSSTLVLGEPGAGKSVAAYEVARAFQNAGLIPVVLRASEFKAVLSPGHEYAEVINTVLKEALEWDVKLALIIDGLDEMTGSSNSITLAGHFIAAAAEVMAVVATCRRREFEEEISRWLPSSTFDRILSVREWTVDQEFHEYVRRLVATHLLDDTDIVRVVESSRALKELVTRPLFARMLTYVGMGASLDVSSVTGLYVKYLDRLSSSCASSLRDADIAEVLDPIRLWELAAQLSFENGLIIDEELNYSAVEALLSRELDVATSSVRRAMGYVLDIHVRGTVMYGQFVHYSFFEFLVASSMHQYVVSGGTATEPVHLAKRLQHDLPRRMRHFSTELLATAGTASVGPLFVGTYRYARQAELRTSVRRTICNLIAYIVSRSLRHDTGLLNELLTDEDDPFLRNSLLWAICHAGDTGGAVTFLRELDASISRRQMNRGYLLYYHGDLSRDLEPPFMDPPPFRSWSYTRGEVLEMMSGSLYQSSVQPARQAIDLYTFFDFAISRGETIQGSDVLVLRRLVDELWNSNSLPVEVGSRLLGQVAVCTADETVQEQRT